MPKAQPAPTASTQEHLDIEDILEDLVILKSGWISMVLSISSVNFGLLSEAEQDAAIYAYAAFLNSLTFPLQVLIRSKKADISSYFAHLEDAEASQLNPDIAAQIKKYKEFISSIVSQKTVLDKEFYLIINFSPLEMGFKGLAKASAANSKNKKQLLSGAKASLAPKRDHIIKQMGRIGLNVKQLTTQELIELFYDIYNPAPTGTQRVILDTESYTTPIVEPAVEIPTEYTQDQMTQTNQPEVPLAGAPLADPQQSQPQTQMAPQQAQNTGGLSQNQAKALADLQASTNRAAGFVNQVKIPPAKGQTQQNNQTPIQPTKVQ